MGHFLTDRAKKYKRPEASEVAPADCTYDVIRGGWLDASHASFVVKSAESKHYMPRTKKDDIETGEDQKGE
jgi:hypothetical protein